METVDYAYDRQLNEFIADFSDGNLDGIELEVFKEYLNTSDPVRTFALKARKGRLSLTNHFKVKAADDFEEKLARRLAKEKNKMAEVDF
jgi:hypothetical protein